MAWVANAAAVHLGEDGTILSSGTFPTPGAGGERSIEFWAQPDQVDDSGTLVAFFDSAGPRQLSVSQSLSDLEIHLESTNAWRSVKTQRMYAADAFHKGESAFWTVTFGPSGTMIYHDVAVIGRSSMKPSGSEVSGRLVVGNSPFGNSWSGVLRGLAVYDTALNRAQIARHYASWTKEGSPALTSDDACIALYLFNEHAGRLVRNKVRWENDLYIPTKYMVLRKTLLDPVWKAFEWSRGFWMDALINVTGFIPFGCAFCAYFSARGLRSPALLASTFGAAVSVFIELTQAHLPTRDSSMSDLINNTVGSVLGAAVYRGAVAQAFDRQMSWIVDALNAFRHTAGQG
ncbi:MAG TPA: VanZ family protein [Terriglobales bacterium]